MTDVIIRGLDDEALIDALRAMLPTYTIETADGDSLVDDDVWTRGRIRTMYKGLRAERQRTLFRGLEHGWMAAAGVRSPNGKLSGLTGSITKTQQRLVLRGELPDGLPPLIRPVISHGSCIGFEPTPGTADAFAEAFKDWPKTKR